PSAERPGDVGGISVTGCMADFSLYIFHPYGGTSLANKPSPNVPDRKDALSVQVEFVKFNLSRSRRFEAEKRSAGGRLQKRVTFSSDRKKAVVRFSTLVDIGSASFKYDMRRLTEILAFPKAWYRRKIVRRLFLGDTTMRPDAEFGSTGASEQNPLNTPTKPSPGFHGMGDEPTTPVSPGTGQSHPHHYHFSRRGTAKGVSLFLPLEPANVPGSTGASGDRAGWETLVVFAVNFTKLNVQMNMSNVMGNVVWLSEGFRAGGRLSIGSSGHKNVRFGIQLSSSTLDAKSGIVGGGVCLGEIDTFSERSQIKEIKAEGSLKDEWRIGPSNDRRPAAIHLYAELGWDQFHLLMAQSTTADIMRMCAKLEEFFTQQLHSGRRVFSSLGSSSSSAGPLHLPPAITLRRQTSRRKVDEQAGKGRHHRHWQRALSLASGLKLSLLSAPLPLQSTVLGGTVEMRGNTISLACFHGINFRSKSWALFALKEPYISFMTESQEDHIGLAGGTHIVQHLSFSLGPPGSIHHERLGSVCRISRSAVFPPQFKTLHEWFHFAFSPNDLDAQLLGFTMSCPSSVDSVSEFRHGGGEGCEGRGFVLRAPAVRVVDLGRLLALSVDPLPFERNCQRLKTSFFPSLTNLESLELRENLLQRLPPSMAQLQRLERLDIGDNEIDEFPECIGSLGNLQELWLDHNQLTRLPPCIRGLCELTCLDVSENHLIELPEEISELKNLTDLHLSQNYLEKLPQGIGSLSQMTILKADMNQLIDLPMTIGNCSSLQELILTENQLAALPDSVGQLVHLTNFNVDRNRLTALPPDVGNLKELGVLSLRDNLISTLPSSLGECSRLHVLDVSGNRLHHLPISLVNLSLKAIWLSENQAQPMLKFQTDVDETTGEEVLTCFLLPQNDPLEGRLYRSPQVMMNDFDGDLSKTGEDSREDAEELPLEERTRTSMVKFADEKNADPDDELERETPFVRHNTPHPKDLKAKAHKLFGTPSSETASSPANEHPPEGPGEAREKAPQPHSVPDDVGIPPPPVRDEPAIDAVTEEPHPQEGENSSSPPPPPTAAEDSDEGERRVGFSDDVPHEVDGQKQSRLHRRDTPHHLKNKRINTSKVETERVAFMVQEAAERFKRPLLASHSEDRPLNLVLRRIVSENPPGGITSARPLHRPSSHDPRRNGVSPSLARPRPVHRAQLHRIDSPMKPSATAAKPTVPPKPKKLLKKRSFLAFEVAV
ncbi:unnamed protein product, partial [Cyprideis torosa]